MNAQQSTIQRLGSKRVIEQLLMQETFARYFELSGFLSHILKIYYICDICLMMSMWFQGRGR